MQELAADFETLAEGYVLAEAPRDDGAGGVWFTDVLGGGGVHHWSAGEVTTLVPGRKGAGGVVVHDGGGVVVSGRSVSHVAPDGSERVLLERPEGVTGFNDLCADPEGNVLAGALRFNPFSGETPVPGELWRVTPEGGSRVAGGVAWPNGLGVEAAGTVVLCDYADGRVVRLGATSDAGQAGSQPAAEVEPALVGTSPSGEADGLAIDGDGGLWIALGGGGALGRLDPDDGTWTHRLPVPAAFVTSVAFVDGGERMAVTTFASGGQPGALLACPAPIVGRPHALARL